jgi:hypothetical protein
MNIFFSKAELKARKKKENENNRNVRMECHITPLEERFIGIKQQVLAK